MTPSSEIGKNPPEQQRDEAGRQPDERVGAPVTDPGAVDREAADRSERGVPGDARPTWPGPTAASSVGQAPPRRPPAPARSTRPPRPRTHPRPR